MAHSPSFECCLERVSMPKRRIVSCVKHRQPAEAWTTLILKLSRLGLSFHGAPQSGCLSWTSGHRNTYCTCCVEVDSTVFQLAAADALLELALVCDLGSGTQQLTMQQRRGNGAAAASTRPGRRHVQYRYRNRTCRCRLGLTHLLSAWFSLGVRSQTDRGKTNDGDATSIHPCSMYGEPSHAVL